MTRVYIADAQLEERRALRLLLLDLEMEVVGEAAEWSSIWDQAPATRLDMLLLDQGVLPVEASAALAELRLACPKAIAVVLIGQLESRQQAVSFTGADAFISKSETAEQVARHLRVAALNALIEVPPANSQG